jgi:hypothetical protein
MYSPLQQPFIVIDDYLLILIFCFISYFISRGIVMILVAMGFTNVVTWNAVTSDTKNPAKFKIEYSCNTSHRKGPSIFKDHKYSVIDKC